MTADTPSAALTDDERSRSAPMLDAPSRVALVASALVATLALALLIGSGSGISPARYLRNDSLFRSAALPGTIEPMQLSDRSGTFYHLPDSVLSQRSLRALQLPLWNRHQGGGYSPLVQLQGGLLSPLRWPLVLVPERHVEDARILFGLAAAFAGCFALLRSLSCTIPGALLGASVFTFSAHQLVFAFLAGPVTFAFLPWSLVIVRAFAARPGPWRFALLAVAAMLTITSGHPELAFVVGLSSAVTFLADHVFARRGWRGLAWPAAGALLGLALSAWAINPFLAALPTHWTYKFDSDVVNYAPLAGLEWLRMLAAMAIPLRGNDFANTLHSVAFLGPATLVLALAGLRTARRDARWRFLLATLPLSFALALPGPWMAAVAWLPGLHQTSATYLVGMLAFQVALAAAAGADELAHALPLSWRNPAFAVATLACVIPPLAVAGSHLSPMRDCWLPSSGGHQVLLADPDTFRVVSWSRVHRPNISLLSGVDDVALTAVLLPERLDAWCAVIDPDPRDRKAIPYVRRPARLDSPVLGLFNVKYVLAERMPFFNGFWRIFPGEDGPFLGPEQRMPRLPGFTLVYRDAFVEVFRNDRFYRSRCDFGTTLHFVDGPDAAAAAMAALGPRVADVDVVEVPDEAMASQLSRHVRPAQGRPELHYPSENEAVMRVSLAAPALVVLNDAMADGWSATIDDQPAPIVPVNILARGVFVEAGAHEIRMSYWPPGLTGGLQITALAALLLMACCSSLRRARATGSMPEGRP